MATFSSITLNGNVATEPTGKAIGDDNYVWNFVLVKNALDKKTKNKASVWFKVAFYAPEDHPFMSKLKKGDCVVVSGDLPYVVDEYTASYGQDKKGNYSLNLGITANGVGRGTFDTRQAPKPEGEESSQSDDFFPAVQTPQDNLVPKENQEFSIPVTNRGPSFS